MKIAKTDVKKEKRNYTSAKDASRANKSSHATGNYGHKKLHTQLYEHSPSERLFFINKYSILRELNKICKLSAVKKYTYTIYATYMLHYGLLGFSPLLISERLGHENVETTLNIYSHLYLNKHEEVAKVLSQLMQMKK